MLTTELLIREKNSFQNQILSLFLQPNKKC
jgi:hypothetical protein